MRLACLALSAVLTVCCVSPCDAEPALGSPDFKPSVDHPVGWRGDGNGRYPAAEPPLTWGRLSKGVKDLSTQAGKPKADDKGKPMPEGVIRDWLVVGPVAIPEGKALKDDFGTDEAKLAPDEGDKLGELVWKPVTLDTSCINFRPMYDRAASSSPSGKAAPDIKKAVAYAHTWIYSAEGKPVFLNVMSGGGGKVWLNGKDLGVINGDGARLPLALVKGWNRLLLRVAPKQDGWSKGVVQWYFNAAFFGADGDTYESKNILWSMRMPDGGPGVGSPILAGGRLFVPTEFGGLLCISPKDGKVLWAKSSSYADAATPEERKSHPEVFAEADALAAKLSDSFKAYGESPEAYFKDPALSAGMAGYGKIMKLLTKMAPEKYAGQSGGEAGWSAQTPVSDGQFVYAMDSTGVVACFDLDGNRKWTTVVGVYRSEHSYQVSPCLADGKLIIKVGEGKKDAGAVALDCKTGAVVTRMILWKGTGGPSVMDTPLAVAVGKEKLIVQSFALISRLSDGKLINQDFYPPFYNIPNFGSPTIEGRTVCSVLWADGGAQRLVFQTLPEVIADPLKMESVKECTYDVKKFPAWFSYDHCASPLLYQGLAYMLSCDGVLTVIDSAKGEVVYQKLLDLAPWMIHNGPIVRAGCSASPTLGGKYIYLWDDQGTCVVIEPGRTFKQVARNRIEQHWVRYGPECNECFVSNPVFSGDKMFMRGQLNLYCIGEKGK